MNAPAKIRTDFGIYVRDPKTRMYSPYERVERYRHPVLIFIAGAILAWAAFIGAGYALWRAFEAFVVS